MKSLKQIINRYIRSAAIVMALVILVVIAFAEILIEQGRVEDTAAGTFVRLEQIIEENSRGCGYTDGTGSETPPGGVILDPNLPITYQTGIIISVTPIGLSSDPLIINVPLTP